MLEPRANWMLQGALVVMTLALLLAAACDKVDQQEAMRKLKSAGYDAKHIAKKAIPDAKKPTGSTKHATLCRENLKKIELAKRAVAQREGKVGGQSVSLGPVLAQMGRESLPVCPAGGKYTLQKVGTLPTCSIGPQDPPTTADDHMIRNF